MKFYSKEHFRIKTMKTNNHLFQILVDRYSPDPMDYVEVDQGNSDDGGSSPVISRKNNSRKRTISETSDGDHFLENLETKTANL